MAEFDDDITERIRKQKEFAAATAAGKTVKQWKEDRQYVQDIADINAENEANEAEDAAEEGEWTPGVGQPQFRPESEAARNARLEGERQADVLRGGGVPEKRDTGSYRALDTASAAQQHDEMMDQEYDKRLTKNPKFRSSGATETEFVGDYLGGGRKGGDDKYAPSWITGRDRFEGSAPSEEYLAKSPEEDVAGENQMVQAEKEFIPPSPDDLGGFMPESPEAMAAAGEQSDFQRDENDPAVKDFKKLNEKAVAGDPKALEDRADIFKGMPKEEKAMAKEELGNYYIGPNGYAINLDKVEADAKRVGRMGLLQHVPVHARAQMLASWGYIDQEDVDNMPDSPEYMVEELKGINKLAEIRAQTESNEKIVDKNISGRDALATKLYASQAEINAANNTLKGRLEDRRIDLGELELDASLFMHGNKLDMEQYIADNKLQLSREELQQLDNHFTKKLSFEYSQMFMNDDYRNRVVDQGDAQFNRKFARLDKQDQEAMIMAEFNRQQKTVEMYLEAGQFNSAVLASAGMPSRLVGFNYKTYYKNKGKTSGTDPIFTAAMGMSDNLVGYMASSGKDVKTLRDEYYNRQDALTTQLMKEGDPGMGEPSFMDQRMSELGMVQFNDLPAISVKNLEGKIITAGKNEYNNNRMQYRSAMRIKIFDQIMKKDPVYGQLYNNINNARTHFQTTGSLDTFGGGGGGKTGGSFGVLKSDQNLSKKKTTAKKVVQKKTEPPVRELRKKPKQVKPKSEVSPESGQYSFQKKLTNAKNNLLQQFKDGGGASVIAGQMVGKKRLERPGEEEKIMTQVKERGRKRLKQLFSRPPSKTGKYTRLLPAEVKSEKAALKYYEKNPAKLDKLSPEVQIYIYNKLANLTEKSR